MPAPRPPNAHCDTCDDFSTRGRMRWNSRVFHPARPAPSDFLVSYRGIETLIYQPVIEFCGFVSTINTTLIVLINLLSNFLCAPIPPTWGSSFDRALLDSIKYGKSIHYCGIDTLL